MGFQIQGVGGLNSEVSNNAAGAATTDNALVVTLSPNSKGPVKLTDGVIQVGVRGDGYLKTSLDPSELFFESFETAFNTTDLWTNGGTSATSAAGTLTLPTSTVANTTSYLWSKPTFQPPASGFMQFGSVQSLTVSAITGVVRWFGFGSQVAPVLASPVRDGVVFVEDTDGLFYAATYSGGVKTQSLALTRPSDGGPHRYVILYKTSKVYFEIDNVLVATFSYPNTQIAALAATIGFLNGATNLSATPVLTSSVISVGDTGKNEFSIKDGQYGFRKATVSPNNALLVAVQPADQAVSATGAAGAAVTATLPAVANRFHYINAILITKYATVALTASATPVVSTSTNLPGSLGFMFGTQGAIGAIEEKTIMFDNPIKSSVINTATTIVLPATSGVIWRINVTYYQA